MVVGWLVFVLFLVRRVLRVCWVVFGVCEHGSCVVGGCGVFLGCFCS